MRPGTLGVEIHESVTPAAGEQVIQKANPNSFLDTALEAELRSSWARERARGGLRDDDEHMCVDATVRAAVDLGFEATVAHDACATCDLEFADETDPGLGKPTARSLAARSATATQPFEPPTTCSSRGPSGDRPEGVVRNARNPVPGTGRVPSERVRNVKTGARHPDVSVSAARRKRVFSGGFVSQPGARQLGMAKTGARHRAVSTFSGRRGLRGFH